VRRLGSLLALSLLALLVTGTSALAVSDQSITVVEQEELINQAPPQVGGASLTRFIVGFAIVIGLIFVARVFLRRSPLGQIPGLGEGSELQVIETRTLTPSRHLHLVRVADAFYVIASTDASVALIGRLDEPATIDRLQQDTPASGDTRPAASGMVDALRALTERRAPAP
jgi:flagellar biogenesis protein FliO